MQIVKQKNSPLTLVLSMLMTAGLVGCVNTSPVVDSNFGNSVNAAKAQQIINPDAALSAAAPDGIGGKPANASLDRYQRSFERPAITPNVFTIGVGTGGGGAGAGGAGASGGATSR
jgi:type IV pilus biogenesis protein CpaD/CtpE